MNTNQPSATPLEFLANAFRIAVDVGEFDLEMESEHAAITLRLQLYNLLRKLRRLERRARVENAPLSPEVEQVLYDSSRVVMSVTKGSAVLKFCRPERTPSARVMLDALNNSESGKALMEQISKGKAEAAARKEAEDREIKESEQRMLNTLNTVATGGTDLSEAQARAAERLKRYGGGAGG